MDSASVRMFPVVASTLTRVLGTITRFSAMVFVVKAQLQKKNARPRR